MGRAERRAAVGEGGLFRRVPRDMFRFTTTDNAELHSAVMQVFGDANEQVETALAFDDVVAGLAAAGWLDAVDEAQLGATLARLVARSCRC